MYFMTVTVTVILTLTVTLTLIVTVTVTVTVTVMYKCVLGNGGGAAERQTQPAFHVYSQVWAGMYVCMYVCMYALCQLLRLYVTVSLHVLMRWMCGHILRMRESVHCNHAHAAL